MKRLVLSAVALAFLCAILAGVVAGPTGETITEQQAQTEHAITVSTNIEGGTLVWTNPLMSVTRLLSVNWKLPASTTSSVTIDHVESRLTKTKNAILYTNSFFDPAVVTTNYYWSETSEFVTNTLYSGATTNAQTVILDAGVSGDLPEYYTIYGADHLRFTFSATNSIPLKWSMRR